MQSSNDDSSGFNFDEWVELAKEDPDAFEERRDALLKQAIEQAPLHFRKKLHGLQFQVDMIRERSAHPMGACVRISSLMMDSLFANESGRRAGKTEAPDRGPRGGFRENNLIPFPQRGAGRRPL